VSFDRVKDAKVISIGQAEDQIVILIPSKLHEKLYTGSRSGEAIDLITKLAQVIKELA